jgi:hypothetical protein
MHRGAAEYPRGRGPSQAGPRYAFVHFLVLFINNEQRLKVNVPPRGKKRERGVVRRLTDYSVVLNPKNVHAFINPAQRKAAE